MKKTTLSAVALSFFLFLAAGSAQADYSNTNSALPSAATAGIPGGVVDPCLNNPNIYVQQSCEQARQAAIKNDAVQTDTKSAQTVITPQMPAWQQALQHEDTENTASTNNEDDNTQTTTNTQSPQ